MARAVVTLIGLMLAVNITHKMELAGERGWFDLQVTPQPSSKSPVKKFIYLPHIQDTYLIIPVFLNDEPSHC